MNEQTQPPVQPQQPPAGPAAPQKKSKTWLWILGGCLAVVIIGALIAGALAWWGAKKARKAYETNVKPQLEEMQKSAEEAQKQSEDWQKNAADWQKEMEKMQKELPASN